MFFLVKKFSDKSNVLRCFVFLFLICFVYFFVVVVGFFCGHTIVTIMVTHSGHTIIPSYP